MHDSLKYMVLAKYSSEVWEKILKATETHTDQHYMKFRHYDDGLTNSLFVKTADILGLTLDEFFHLFGSYWIQYVIDIGFSQLLAALGPNLRGFVENVDTIHTLLAECYNNVIPPMYRCEPLRDGNLHLHYFSYRKQGLHRLCMGWIEGVAKHLYHSEVKVTLVSTDKFKVQEDEVLQHAVIHVELPPEERNYSTLQQDLHWMKETVLGVDIPEDEPATVVDQNGKTIISTRIFSIVWPYHIIFDKKLIIRQVGRALIKFCPAVHVGRELSRVCEIILPRVPFDFYHFLDYVNVNFNIQIFPIEGSKPLLLKGQMMPMDANHLLFICSPKMKNLEELVEKKLFLNEVPIYDTTRQFVMLNQVRNAEIGISARLEETTMKLKATAAAVEAEHAKMDMLLHELLPKKVADALKRQEKVPAEKFDVVSIVLSDIVGFTTIASSCKPMQVVHMLTQLYRIFDGLCDKHGLYKVETIGDAYMVVGGVPDHSTTHAVDCASFALEAVAAAPSVCSPYDDKPLEVRMGMHCGPAVAGVVGGKMPRYCLFGDSVHWAEKMESHSEGGRVHISAAAHSHLENEAFEFEDRGFIEIKGRGELNTHFLIGKKLPLE